MTDGEVGGIVRISDAYLTGRLTGACGCGAARMPSKRPQRRFRAGAIVGGQADRTNQMIKVPMVAPSRPVEERHGTLFGLSRNRKGDAAPIPGGVA
jgi:hypothetical protein